MLMILYVVVFWRNKSADFILRNKAQRDVCCWSNWFPRLDTRRRSVVILFFRPLYRRGRAPDQWVNGQSPPSVCSYWLRNEASTLKGIIPQPFSQFSVISVTEVFGLILEYLIRLLYRVVEKDGRDLKRL